MSSLLLEHREGLLSVAFYGTIFVVVLWEAYAGFRALPDRPLARWANNIGIGILGYALERWLLVAAGFSAAMYAEHTNHGLLNNIEIPETAAIILTVLFLDCLFYWVHRAYHAIPLLWRLHCVHHSDTALDFSIAFRRHPLELLINVSIIAPIIIALGLPATGVLLFQLLRAVILFSEHANARLPDRLDRWVRYLFVTPNMHCVHHSAVREETDSNFSDLFPVWDRIFGSYREHPAASEDTMNFGLEYFRHPDEGRIDRMFLQPFRFESRNWTTPKAQQ